ncbi:hypothetical protein [Micromonospora sp. NPDC048830]|uniref:hypothetical protein n=1 Tax=Micromonospora sp. NPDC048830 TaxID=3364257 RepID=UPI00371B3057
MNELPYLSALTGPMTRTDGNGLWFDLGCDPQETNRLGTAIAAILSTRAVGTVLSWEGEEEAVLAHVVASAMGARRATVVQERGLLFTSAEPPAGSTVALVATRLTSSRPMLPVMEMMRERGHRFDCALTLHPPRLHVPPADLLPPVADGR